MYDDRFDEEAEAKSSGFYFHFKVGKKEHLEDFANGTLYCNSLQYHVQREDAALRDENEGIIAIYQPVHIQTLQWGPIDVPPRALAGPVRFSRDEQLRVFCMYAVHPGAWKREFTNEEVPKFIEYMTIKPRIRTYGDHVAIVTNARALHDRVLRAARLLNITARAKLVRYYDLSKRSCAFEDDEFGFIKDVRFKDEREWRIVFSSRRGLKQPFRLKVGSLRDIVKVVTWDEFAQDAKLRLPDAREFRLVPEAA